jgi:hypothetical protein
MRIRRVEDATEGATERLDAWETTDRVEPMRTGDPAGRICALFLENTSVSFGWLRQSFFSFE